MRHFINEGFGWECRRCRAATVAPDTGPYPRFYIEGEAEDKVTRLTTTARARWRDAAQQILYCPNCLAEETARKT